REESLISCLSRNSETPHVVPYSPGDKSKLDMRGRYSVCFQTRGSVASRLLPTWGSEVTVHVTEAWNAFYDPEALWWNGAEPCDGDHRGSGAELYRGLVHNGWGRRHQHRWGLLSQRHHRPAGCGPIERRKLHARRRILGHHRRGPNARRAPVVCLADGHEYRPGLLALPFGRLLLAAERSGGHHQLGRRDQFPRASRPAMATDCATARREQVLPLIEIGPPGTPQPPRPRAHTATIFTSFFGRTITFLIVLPSRNGFTFSEARAAASRSAWEALADTLITSRSLPLTWTGISSVSSTSRAGSNFGQGA